MFVTVTANNSGMTQHSKEQSNMRLQCVVLDNNLILKQHFFNWQVKNIATVIYLFKVNSENTRTMCEICSKLTIKTPDGECLSKTTTDRSK